MAKGVSLTPEYVINGSFGELIGFELDASGNIINSETVFLANIQEITATVMKDYNDLFLSGTRQKRQKLMASSGEGTIRGFKITSDFLRVVANVLQTTEGTGSDTVGNKHHNIDTRLTMIVNLDDPEALGKEQVRLIGVKMREIPLGWRVNEIVEESIPFTFEQLEFIEKVTGNQFSSQYATRYENQRNL